MPVHYKHLSVYQVVLIIVAETLPNWASYNVGTIKAFVSSSSCFDNSCRDVTKQNI